jgi:predicted metal-dependent peptidase
MPNVSLYPLIADDDELDIGIEPYPGLTRDFTFHIVAMVDTSGSVSDEDYMTFLSEINGIMKAERGISIQFIMYDSAIQHEVLIGGKEGGADLEDNRGSVSRYGYGGTCFDPPFRRLVGLDTDEDWLEGADRAEGRIPKPDLGIMLTDGYAPMPSVKPDCPVIWVLTSGGRSDPEMGDRVIELNY